MEATRSERVARREARIDRRRASGDAGFDYILLLLTFVILGFGMLMIYSSSSYSAQVKYQDSTFFLRKQAMNVAIGAVAMFLAVKFDYRMFIRPLFAVRLKLVNVMYAVAVILQVWVLIDGSGLNGAKRWLSIGPISFQPSELTKVILIIVTAYYLYAMPPSFNSWKALMRVFVPISVPIILIAAQDLSSAIVIFAVAFGMCTVRLKNKFPLLVIAIVSVGLVLLYIFVIGASFRQDRIEIWKDPEGHPKGGQIVHGLYAIASGGLFGSGLGESMQKLGFLPEPYNDMIFSVICEELGLIGAGIVIAVFILLCWRIYGVATRTADLYGALICAGVMVHIASQAIINIAVVTNTIPSTGIPLPFISYGGSSVIFLMIEIGIVLGISAKTEQTTGRRP